MTREPLSLLHAKSAARPHMAHNRPAATERLRRLCTEFGERLPVDQQHMCRECLKEAA